MQRRFKNLAFTLLLTGASLFATVTCVVPERWFDNEIIVIDDRCCDDDWSFGDFFFDWFDDDCC